MKKKRKSGRSGKHKRRPRQTFSPELKLKVVMLYHNCDSGSILGCSELPIILGALQIIGKINRFFIGLNQERRNL
jgi:hypothetical protein